MTFSRECCIPPHHYYGKHCMYLYTCLQKRYVNNFSNQFIEITKNARKPFYFSSIFTLLLLIFYKVNENHSIEPLPIMKLFDRAEIAKIVYEVCDEC